MRTIPVALAPVACALPAQAPRRRARCRASGPPASAQDSPKGKKQFMTIATANTGKHKVAWYVGGKKVGSWNFVVTEG